MKKQDFIALLDRGAASLQRTPVSAAVLRWVSAALKSGDPEWWKLIEKSWEKRKFVLWSEPWILLLSALHYEALNDPDCPLVPFFPSCGGTDEAEPGTGLARFLPDAPDTFYEHLKTGHARPYTALKTKFWPIFGGLFFDSRELPYYIVDTGAAAGLNLVADALVNNGTPSPWVAARVGTDSQPLELSDLNDRRWVTAALPPDAPKPIAELDASIELAIDLQRRDPNFLQLVECAPLNAPKFIAKNIPADDQDVGLLVFNAGVTARMDDAEYKAYSTAMLDMMKAWGERALWIEAEPVRAEMYSTTLEFRATRMIEGVPSQKTLVRIDFEHPQRPDFGEAVRFLYPKDSRISLQDLLKSAKAA